MNGLELRRRLQMLPIIVHLIAESTHSCKISSACGWGQMSPSSFSMSVVYKVDHEP